MSCHPRFNPSPISFCLPTPPLVVCYSTLLGSLRGVPHSWLVMSPVSLVCDGVSLLVCFRVNCVIAICPYFLFYWARLVLRFHSVCESVSGRAFLLGSIAAPQLGLLAQLLPSPSAFL